MKKYQNITIKVPVLDDVAAFHVQNFIYKITDAIDKHYYQQIKRYCKYEAMISCCNDHSSEKTQNLGDPPF
jgi:hypothetical protein